MTTEMENEIVELATNGHAVALVNWGGHMYREGIKDGKMRGVFGGCLGTLIAMCVIGLLSKK